MKKVVFPSKNRGTADHGWLKANYSFSFAGYQNPINVHFGALRVLNDDTVAPGMGFGTHPHDNMEIITIPLKGSLAHKDSMGNSSVIKSGEVQIMSAGTGIEHSEYNPSSTEEINLFQIWIFPKEKNITPRYDQKLFSQANRINTIQPIVSPVKNDFTLWINQNAYLSLLDLEEQKTITYSFNVSSNGLYIMLIDGEVEIENEVLSSRDAIGITEVSEIQITANKNSQLLFIEVPFKW